MVAAQRLELQRRRTPRSGEHSSRFLVLKSPRSCGRRAPSAATTDAPYRTSVHQERPVAREIGGRSRATPCWTAARRYTLHYKQCFTFLEDKFLFVFVSYFSRRCRYSLVWRRDGFKDRCSRSEECVLSPLGTLEDQIAYEEKKSDADHDLDNL